MAMDGDSKGANDEGSHRDVLDAGAGPERTSHRTDLQSKQI